MKNVRFLFPLLGILLLTSCRKNENGIFGTHTLQGEWIRHGYLYAVPGSQSEWVYFGPDQSFPEIATFLGDGRFQFKNCIPATAGSYEYKRSSGLLTLEYLSRDLQGNVVGTHTEHRLIELLKRDRLIISYSLANGTTIKTEYTRAH